MTNNFFRIDEQRIHFSLGLPLLFPSSSAALVQIVYFCLVSFIIMLDWFCLRFWMPDLRELIHSRSYLIQIQETNKVSTEQIKTAAGIVGEWIPPHSRRRRNNGWWLFKFSRKNGQWRNTVTDKNDEHILTKGTSIERQIGENIEQINRLNEWTTIRKP